MHHIAQHLPKQLAARLGRRWSRSIFVMGILFLAMGGGVSYAVKTIFFPAPDSPEPAVVTQPASHHEQTDGRRDDQRFEVGVVHPSAGGFNRRIVQTGSIEAIESTDVYAKVSGYLRTVHVDIGTKVEAGQVLGEVDVPELALEVKRRETLLEQARGSAQQADAKLKVMEAQQSTAAAVISEAESKIRRHAAERELYRKECNRLQKLVEQGAVEEKLLDEKRHQLEIAKAAEEQARQTVRVAKAQWSEAGPRVELARAESITAHAAVQVAAAEVEQSETMLKYCRIVSPFTGVVTRRNVDSGNFVRSAAEGGNAPLFRISRTDQMKVVVSVPERFVPYINPNDRAEVRVGALHGEVFEGKVTRVARLQERETRTMRVEIDLPNPGGRLVDGMYASTTITSPPPPDSLTVPSSSLASGTRNGQGSLYVVREGQLTEVPVWVGQNEGERAEVLAGLEPEDLVVAQMSDSLRIYEGHFADVHLESNAEDALAGASISGNP